LLLHIPVQADKSTGVCGWIRTYKLIESLSYRRCNLCINILVYNDKGSALGWVCDALSGMMKAVIILDYCTIP